MKNVAQSSPRRGGAAKMPALPICHGRHIQTGANLYIAATNNSHPPPLPPPGGGGGGGSPSCAVTFSFCGPLGASTPQAANDRQSQPAKRNEMNRFIGKFPFWARMPG